MSEIGFVRKDMFKHYLAGIIGATITMFAAAMICIAFGAFTIERAEFSFGYMLLFTFGWIIQGLAEEVMCRGFMMTAIAKRYSVPVAIITNSIVFALLHILNSSGMTILAMVNLFMYGVLASLMYLYTQNIWLCAAYHTTWNMIQGNVLNIPVSGVKVPSVFETTFNDKLAAINGGAFGMEGGIAVTIVVIIGCALLLMMIKRKKQT